MPNFEIRRELLDATMGGILGERPSPHRMSRPGLEHYFVDGREVSREEFERLRRAEPMPQTDHAPDERRLRDQVCPQCHREFGLCWNDYSNRKQTLILRGCPSGGIYDVSIACPHCDYVEEL